MNVTRNRIGLWFGIFLILVSGTAFAGELKGRVVAPAGKGPAVVFLMGVTGAEPPKTDSVIRHLKGGRFEPKVSIGFVGNDFVFKNEDDKLHTTHLYLHLAYQKAISGRPIENGATLYNIAMPQPGMVVRRPIKAYHEFREDTGFIDVRCNPHPEESAYMLVFNHPYATITDEDGTFTIADVPAGKRDVWVWFDGKAGQWQTVEVKGTGATEVVVEVGH